MLELLANVYHWTALIFTCLVGIAASVMVLRVAGKGGRMVNDFLRGTPEEQRERAYKNRYAREQGYQDWKRKQRHG